MILRYEYLILKQTECSISLLETCITIVSVILMALWTVKVQLYLDPPSRKWVKWVLIQIHVLL